MFIITDIENNIIKTVYTEEEAKKYVEEHPGTFYQYTIC